MLDIFYFHNQFREIDNKKQLQVGLVKQSEVRIKVPQGHMKQSCLFDGVKKGFLEKLVLELGRKGHTTASSAGKE